MKPVILACVSARVFPQLASYLSAIETDGHHTQLVGVGEETGSDSGWLRHRAYRRSMQTIRRTRGNICDEVD